MENNISNDAVLAQLTCDFGDEIHPDLIFKVCTKFKWNLEDCVDNLIKIRNEERIGGKMKAENDVDMVVESEEIQNITPSRNEVNESEHVGNNIEIEGKNVLAKQQFSYSGAIRKTNQNANNFNIVDSPRTSNPVRSITRARFHDQPHLQKIANEINAGLKVMIIMRGAPGCGKSYLAREIVAATTNDETYNHIFSTDSFFYDQRGNYHFDVSKLGDAHDSNRKRVDQYAGSGWSPIIVDNTNIKVWEMRNYFEIAVRWGYMVHIVEPNNPWSRAPGRLAMKNSHNVPKEAIERMLTNYEPTSVSSAMNCFGLNYRTSTPQYRLFPPINVNSNPHQSNGTIQQFASKPQPTTKSQPKRSNFAMPGQIPDVVQYESVEEAFQNVDKNNEWIAFDKDQFWNNNIIQPPQQTLQWKEQRGPKQTSSTDTKNELHSNLFAILKEKDENVVNKSSTDDGSPKVMLHKHRKNCKNENNSFAQIREIYPSVALEILWDLFEKCEGDGDWTMDILLKEETRVGDYDNLDRAKNDFQCDCDFVNVPTTVEDVSTIDASTINQRPIRRDRSTTNIEEQLAAKRIIEGSFQIGDQHYSDHTRKIRNLRRGVLSPAIPVTESVPNDGACAIDVDETEPNDELLEINLGMDLVCQLDSVFGVEAYQKDALTDMKTNVFMPKSLAQQLYALWMESMYNQLEEQRKKSIKEDAEFAKQLQSQQNYPGLYKHAKPPSDLKDIMEMEYAWAAYKTEMDEWKLKTPQDLALQMTHDKLCNIFPNVDRDTLIEVLAAHNNKFTETVDVLKDTLSGKPEEKILNEGRELFEEVRAAVEMTTNDYKISRNGSETSLEIKKLGPEEAKRSALKEFEDTRNLAMRHTQLKAECYNKAKEAIQRGQTSVALYYSQVANLHKSKIDTYNHKAANCIMEVHNLTQNNPDMLDLHYLHVNEAAECLDIFLDKHISKLKTKPQTYKYIFVITGRGLHSANGISTIKQRVKNRFRDRNLTWSEVNPGLLKVKIFANSRLTISL